MIRVHVLDEDTKREATVEIPLKFAPSLRSAITEIRNELGERAKGAYKYKEEQSLTNAIAGTGALASALNSVISEDDPDYKW